MKDYLVLCKPRIAVMVLAMTTLGFLLSGRKPDALLAWTLAGTGLAACAAFLPIQFSNSQPNCRRPARPGDPVFQRRLCLTETPLEYWITRFRG